MNNLLLHIEIQEYIKNYSEDISKLAFSGSPFENVSVQELIQQIESRKKIEKKLPSWFQGSFIYYPPKLNLEQTSSELTARYKSSLVGGEILLDITGGFGVDALYFSKNIETVHHIEHDASLSAIVAHNFNQFKITNVQCFVGDGIKHLVRDKWDFIYVDPSRRHNTKGKVFFLKDCEPNVPENLDLILEHCQSLIIKTSPMLDISAGLNELKHVSQIHIIAVNNEVKELLWIVRKGFNTLPEIMTVNILKNSSETFNFQLNQASKTTFSLPETYLYEPNAAIMKSGAFDLLSEEYQINKLHKNTHLYTSKNPIEFPGRRFIIIDQILYNKASIKKELKLQKANITTRNFPETVSSLRKKLKIKDGGDHYLFFTTLENNQKVILTCRKIK